MQQAFLCIGVTFSADDLYVKKGLVVGQQAVRNFFRRSFCAILKQIQNQEMQYDVIVGEAFGFPHAKERIGVKKIAVYCEGDVGAVRCMVFSDIRSKPAFQPPAFVIIGTGTLLRKVISGLESVDVQIVRRKCNAYTKEGLLQKEKNGKTVFFSLDNTLAVWIKACVKSFLVLNP